MRYYFFKTNNNSGWEWFDSDCGQKEVRKIALQMLIRKADGFLRPFGSKPAELERHICPNGRSLRLGFLASRCHNLSDVSFRRCKYTHIS